MRSGTEVKEKRVGENTPKIGSNKLSTIFAGLNTLKRLEIRLAGGPFVHGVPADRHEGLQRVIRARKREEDRVEERRDPSQRGISTACPSVASHRAASWRDGTGRDGVRERNRTCPDRTRFLGW